MNIHEYQAKAVLKEFGVPVSRGVPVLKASEAEAAAKEQMKADGRLGVAFFSRSVNEAPGYGGTRYGNGGYVFEDSRQPVLDRLAELTGQPTFDLTLARWENTPGIDFGH